MSSPRTCFVIMPFSATESCSEQEWTDIFNTKIRPAVEGAGFGYECRRSQATRGNVLGGIMRDLAQAHVVVADLTDSNANVFYELGVRHALTNRTILIAQSEGSIPSDLKAYAWHVYDWRTEKGVRELSLRIKELLAEIESWPDRPDNPVADFIRTDVTPRSRMADSIEPVVLIPPMGRGMTGRRSALSMHSEPDSQALRALSRATIRQLRVASQALIEDLSAQEIPKSISDKDQTIMEKIVSDFTDKGDQIFSEIERFCWAAAELDSPSLLAESLRFIGVMISASENHRLGANRVALATPAFFAWRAFMVAGAVAVSNGSFDALKLLVNEPVEVESSEGTLSISPLIQRRTLFWPEFTLGNANWGFKALHRSLDLCRHVAPMFSDDRDFLVSLGTFELIVGLLDAKLAEGRPLYPGYLLNPENQRVVAGFSTRIVGASDYVDSIAAILNESAQEFKDQWTARIAYMNSLSLGSQFFPTSYARLPATFGGPAEIDW